MLPFGGSANPSILGTTAACDDRHCGEAGAVDGTASVAPPATNDKHHVSAMMRLCGRAGRVAISHRCLISTASCATNDYLQDNVSNLGPPPRAAAQPDASTIRSIGAARSLSSTPRITGPQRARVRLPRCSRVQRMGGVRGRHRQSHLRCNSYHIEFIDLYRGKKRRLHRGGYGRQAFTRRSPCGPRRAGANARCSVAGWADRRATVASRTSHRYRRGVPEQPAASSRRSAVQRGGGGRDEACVVEAGGRRGATGRHGAHGWAVTGELAGLESSSGAAASCRNGAVPG